MDDKSLKVKLVITYKFLDIIMQYSHQNVKFKCV